MPESGPAEHIAVVGGGVGGLSAAIDLALRGLRVSIWERAEKVGGKLRTVDFQLDGSRVAVDSGPTVLTMAWVFESLFEDAGFKLEDFVSLKALDCLARHHWEDGSSLDLFSDPERSAAAIEAFSDRENAVGYRHFSAYAQRLFETVEAPFIRGSRPSPLTILRSEGWRGLARFTTVDWQRSMWRALKDFFPDPRLRQLFGRYATYYGSSPFRCPATLNLIAHVERAGVWKVEGGMDHLASALRELAEKLGVSIHCGAEVGKIAVEGKRARGIVVGGEKVEVDAVVCNAAPTALTEGVLGDEVRGALRSKVTPRSLSALCWSMVADARGQALEHHNVFFSNDYEAEFRELFDQERLPSEPTVYLCAPDCETAGEGAAMMEGESGQRLFFLVNAPAQGDRREFTAQEIEACQRSTFSRLERCGLQVGLGRSVVRITAPKDFEAMFPATGGALYGAATHGFMAPFQRPVSRTRVRGLYLAGGGSHPGAGLPMVALSGRLAAEAVFEDLASTPK